MKLQQLLVEATAKMEPISVTKSDDGRIEVSSPVKVMPTVGVVADVLLELVLKHSSKVTVSNLKGPAYTTDDVWKAHRNKPQRFFVAPKGKTTIDAAEELVKKVLAAKTKSSEKYAAGVAKAKAQKETPAYKKAVADIRKAKTTAKSDDQDAKYGKGTWKRTSIKQEGGDDGYSYVLRVDGKVKIRGLTKREAEAEQRSAADAIAKKEKLGKYAAE